MLLPVLSVRRFLLLGMMLASLVALADGIARYELQQATGGVAFTAAGASDE
ncbi:hypothetical protein MKK84_06920 [Methylobacterium sp. E-065]|uniref:hypothetical protein n=1 Tax=Methylobacterium sp. E-065 TaxID=2836583 RepID=UPI001FBA7D1C|nr:hypothetical protein [Methylobacterium sp. E-065]MCJ2017155.1 hypothetical protein [Methylobacterium sp. E-065]